MSSDYWASLEALIKESGMTIDRKKGSTHPKYPDFTYPVDYRHVNNSRSMDNNEIDIFVGSEKVLSINGIICTFDHLKNDSEIKIIYSCSNAETEAILNFYKNSRFMKAILVSRNKLDEA
jgi:inorganic pyrophosphatase